MRIKIENLKKDFQMRDGTELKVLDDINLEIAENEIISVVGPSGCGKSTLLKIIVGLDKQTSGNIYLNDELLNEENQSNVGIIFQEARLFPWSTVEKNIAFGITDRKLSKEERDEIVHEHIKLVGLEGFEKALPEQLSGGMKQRVSIARSLVHSPKVLLLDEPFGALDAFTKINMQKEVLGIWNKEKTTMILVTHDIDEAIYMGDRVVVMSPKPGVIQKIIPVDLPRERDRSSNDFAYLRRKVYKEFWTIEEENLDYVI